MKYCRKCGMLLEDTQELCIGCGLDVSNPDNYSLYPIDLEAKIETEKKDDKKKKLIIGAIILVFVLIVILVVALFMNSDSLTSGLAIPENKSESLGEVKEPDDSAAAMRTPEDIKNEAETPKHVIPDNRTVSDAKGSYYIYKTVQDNAGSDMFTTVYPEDMVNTEYSFDYTKYSDVFPALLTFVASNSENTIRFSYMSPQHFWYQNATKGQSRTNEVDLDNYMSFLEYSNAQAYIEALIKQSYQGAKKVELVDTTDISESIDESLKLLLKEHTKTLTGDMGDYAKLGSSTTYAVGEGSCEAKIYKYNIINSKGENIYCEFYVPIIANTFYYANDATSQQGSITEWMPLAVYSYESGNDETYEYYKEAFDVFINNSKLTKAFFKVNELYGADIDSAIAVKGNDPKPLTDETLETYKSELEGSISLNELDSDVYDFLNSRDDDLNTFDGANHKITGSADSVQCFFSEEKQMVFLTPDETEYPGGDYTDMFYN